MTRGQRKHFHNTGRAGLDTICAVVGLACWKVPCVPSLCVWRVNVLFLENLSQVPRCCPETCIWNPELMKAAVRPYAVCWEDGQCWYEPCRMGGAKAARHSELEDFRRIYGGKISSSAGAGWETWHNYIIIWWFIEEELCACSIELLVIIYCRDILDTNVLCCRLLNSLR